MVDSDEEEDFEQTVSSRERPEPDDWPYEPSDRECDEAAMAYVGWRRSLIDQSVRSRKN